MVPTSKPTLILVHGAWHGPDCWFKILPLLEAEGYKCFAPQLKVAGHEPAVPTIEPDVRLIQELIVGETSAGKDVVIVTHSWGGHPGMSAVQGLTQKKPTHPNKGTGNIIGIVGIATFLVPNGESFLSMMGPGATSGPFWGPDTNKEWAVFHEGTDSADLFYNDLPADEAAQHAKALRNQSYGAMASPVGSYAGWLDVPVWYIYTANDKALPVDFAQRSAIVEPAIAAGGAITTRSILTGHSPFLSKPKETVDLILEAARSFI